MKPTVWSHAEHDAPIGPEGLLTGNTLPTPQGLPSTVIDL
jgi:hypothetical protein